MRAVLSNTTVLAWLVFALVLLGAGLVDPGVVSLASLRAQASIGTIIGVVALGQTLVVLSGQIDLSIPWAMTLSAMVMTSLFAQGVPAGLSILAALLVGAAVGAVNALGVAVFRVQSLVWTLAMNMVLQGVTLVYTNSQPPRGNVPPVARELATATLAGVPVAALVWVVLAAIAVVALRRGAFGRRVYATGMNPLATLLCGLDIRRVWAMCFVVSGLCSAFAGILLSGYTSEAYLGMGNDYLLVPIAAVVLGGTSILGGSGGYIGTVAGTLIMLFLQSSLSVAQVSEAGRDVLFGCIILGMVILYARRGGHRMA